MTHNLAVTLFILAVYVAAVVTPLAYASKSPVSKTAKDNEATKERDAPAEAPEAPTKGSAKNHKGDTKRDASAEAPAPDASTKGSAKDHEAKTKGNAPTKAPEAAKENAAEGPGAPMSWPEGGPKFAELVIKNPSLETTSPSSDGLPIDPTPEGSMNTPSSDGLPIDPTPEGSMT